MPFKNVNNQIINFFMIAMLKLLNFIFFKYL